MEKNNDRWLRIVLPIVLIIIALYNARTLTPPYSTEKLENGIYIIVSFIISFEIARRIIFAVRRKFQSVQKTRNYVLLSAGLVISAVTATKLVLC